MKEKKEGLPVEPIPPKPGKDPERNTTGINAPSTNKNKSNHSPEKTSRWKKVDGIWEKEERKINNEDGKSSIDETQVFSFSSSLLYPINK